MNIGYRTREFLENFQTELSNITYKRHEYNTRIQQNMHKVGTINISFNSSIENINELLYKMRAFLPGINYCCNIGNILQNITIECDEQNFQLSGKNIDLYSFLNNNIGLYLLDVIYQDIYNPIKNITSQHYDKIFMNKTFYFNDEVKNKTCSICLTKFTPNKKLIVKTDCGHYFHNQCLKKWLTGTSIHNLNCPNCREPIVPSGTS
jgi:hypothetical protein